MLDNSCDVLQRVHAYSPLWLWLAVLPVTTEWDTTLGLAAVMLFLIALPFSAARSRMAADRRDHAGYHIEHGGICARTSQR